MDGAAAGSSSRQDVFEGSISLAVSPLDAPLWSATFVAWPPSTAAEHVHPTAGPGSAGEAPEGHVCDGTCGRTNAMLRKQRQPPLTHRAGGRWVCARCVRIHDRHNMRHSMREHAPQHHHRHIPTHLQEHHETKRKHADRLEHHNRQMKQHLEITDPAVAAAAKERAAELRRQRRASHTLRQLGSTAAAHGAAAASTALGAAGSAAGSVTSSVAGSTAGSAVGSAHTRTGSTAGSAAGSTWSSRSSSSSRSRARSNSSLHSVLDELELRRQVGLQPYSAAAAAAVHGEYTASRWTPPDSAGGGGGMVGMVLASGGLTAQERIGGGGGGSGGEGERFMHRLSGPYR